MSNYLLFFIIFIFSNQLRAMDITNENLSQVANSKKWLRLLHYGKDQRSRLDGKEFFFANDGATNPLSELKATIKGLSSDKKIGRLKLRPQCAFPERLRFLNERLNLKYEEVKCPQLDQFFQRYHNPIGISLVFSSAYPNNPASMFGHTFLKINSKRKSELLDMGVNFAAWTPKDINMLEFMYKGVVGGYPGLWSMEPYYKKVNEYINSESRDLWEYELSISPEDTKRILSHLWELEVTSYFDYYFFDENCAFQILKAIEAVKTDWDITRHNIYVIPGETVKNVMSQKGIVKDVKFRPSLYHQTQIMLSDLSKEQQESALNWMNRVENKETTPKVLKVALSGIMYKKAKNKKSWTKSDQDWENKVLSIQAKNPTIKESLEIPKHLLKTRPDYGHDPFAVFIGIGAYSRESNENKLVTTFKLRSAYHDLLGSDKGYTPFSEIEFPWLEFQYNHDLKKFQFNELGGFNTTSLFPISKLDKRKSWRVKLTLEREKESYCLNCIRPVTEVGIGLTLGNLKYRLYSLGIAVLDFHPKLNHGYRGQGGVEVGYIWNPIENWKFKSLLQHLYDPKSTIHSNNAQLNLAYHQSKNTELRLSFLKKHSSRSIAKQYQNSSVNFIRYFR